MAERSLSVSPEFINQVRGAIASRGLTQHEFATKAGISRASVVKFLASKPLDRKNFVRCCSILEIDWEQVSGTTSSPQATEQIGATEVEFDKLLKHVRQKVYADIHHRCGTMRVLDMEQPIGIGDIYTNVNILEKLSGRRRLGLDELLQDCDLENFDRFLLGQIRHERVPGLEAVEHYDKLMILGKPGAGKTTFMKRLATLCNQGEFQAQRVPVFVTLKEFAEAPGKPGLQTFIARQWRTCGVETVTIPETQLAERSQNSETQLAERSRSQSSYQSSPSTPDSSPEWSRRGQLKQTDACNRIFEQGRALVLLDGLDEVQEVDHDRVLKELKDFTYQFRDCQFIMTCRIAAREYTFQHFTEVEIADFNQEQIAEFATKWFLAKQDPEKGESFIQRLEDNEPIQELATNPLLLTLLCLVFGEAADFPANRSELYKEGLDVLLKKWDAKRNIERDQVYKKLSLKRKEDLLSQLAFETFERGDYFFKQKVVEELITNYIRNLPGAKEEEEALQLDSEAVLKSIEAQHGLLVERAKSIYSFSHLTFQEYFAAKQIVSPTTKLSLALQSLATHITERRYREVFLLAVGMLPEADNLLMAMKQQIDALITDDAELQKVLNWVNEKDISVETFYKPAVTRSFYLALTLDFDFNCIDFRRDKSFSLDHELAFALALTLAIDLSFSLARSLNPDHDLVFSLVKTLEHAIKETDEINKSLKPKLEHLKAQLPTIQDLEIFVKWWRKHGSFWAIRLRKIMIEYRNIGHDWQFTDVQKETLKQYYDANKLLVDCLNSDCYVNKPTRQYIEDTLLLPMSEIEKYEKPSG